MERETAIDEVELVPVTCQICKQPLGALLPPEDSPYRSQLERMARTGAVHDACLARQEKQEAAAKLLLAENAKLTCWRTFCPAEFQKPLNWNVKAANRSNLNKVLAWSFGERGLIVTGKSGRCKSRFVWRLLEREWLAGHTVSAHTHAAWRQTISALASADSEKALQFIQGLAKVGILFIDDLGKGRATPASEEAFFDLLDARLNACRPNIFTIDIALERLEEQFSEDYARGMMRRIVERCDKVEF